MALDNPWLRIMLEEIERKRRDEQEARQELAKRIRKPDKESPSGTAAPR